MERPSTAPPATSRPPTDVKHRSQHLPCSHVNHQPTHITSTKKFSPDYKQKPTMCINTVIHTLALTPSSPPASANDSMIVTSPMATTSVITSSALPMTSIANQQHQRPPKVGQGRKFHSLSFMPSSTNIIILFLQTSISSCPTVHRPTRRGHG